MTPMLTPPPTRGLIEGSLSGEGCACRFCQATLLRTNAYFMHPSLRLFRQLFLLGGPVDPNVSYAGPRAPKGRDSSSSSSKESSSNSSGSFCKNSSVDVNSVSDNRSGSSSLDSWLKLYANGKSAVHVHACGVRPRGPHSFTGTAAAKEAVPPNSNSSGPPSSRIGEVSSSNGVHGVRTDDSRASGDPSESSCNAWGGELVSKEWVVLHYAMLVPQDVIRRCASAQAWQDPVLPFQQAACAAVNRYKGNTARAAAAAGAVFLHHLELSESSYVQCTRSAVRDVKTAVKHLCTAVDSNNCSTLVTSSSTSRTGSGHCQHARPLRVNKGTLKEAGQGSHHGEVSSQAGVPGSASCRHISGIGTEHGWCRLHAVHERLIPLLEQAGLLRQLHMVADWHQHTSLCI